MRRVITGLGPDGRSVVTSDGPPPVAFHAVPERGFARIGAPWTGESIGTGEAVVHELWALDDQPTPSAVDPTLTVSAPAYDPPPATTKWIITQMGPSLTAPMHATPTVDYAVVVSGEVELILEADRVLLGPGDTVLVNGVRHAWVAGPEGCVIATVLIGLGAGDR